MKIPAARVRFDDAQRAEILSMIDDSLKTGTLTLGPHTSAFEDAFALRHAAPFAIATTSGTAALEIILRARGVEGGEVIVPANTFFATAAAVLHAGGAVRLADIDVSSMALSVASVEAAFTDRTVGVIHVHIGGMVSEATPAIAELCRNRGVWLIEDAAHAHGSSYRGISAGGFGTAAAFSFYPTKVVTSGEGGMITTDDATLRDEARIYRDQGKAGFLGGDHVRLGYSWRMSEIHAVIGLVHLRSLDTAIAHRSKTARYYDDNLAEVPGITLVRPPADSVCNYYKYVTLLDRGVDRDAVKRHMLEQSGVSASGEVYAKPLHRHPVFSSLSRDGLGVAEDACSRQLCLPLHSDMTMDEAAAVVLAVRNAVESCRR
jgi:dTDP-4-amino-4,6-dideoxygalactose transaminase